MRTTLFDSKEGPYKKAARELDIDITGIFDNLIDKYRDTLTAEEFQAVIINNLATRLAMDMLENMLAD